MRIGIGVGANEVRVVGLRDGLVVFAASATASDGALQQAAAVALRQMPRSRFRHYPAVVAIGPAHAQLRRISGLPPGTTPADAAGIVRENASRFFLRNGAPILTSTVVETRDEGHWAAAFDAPLVTAIEETCRGARLRLLAVVPTASVLGRALVNDQVQWTDGDAAIECRYAAELLVGARRLATPLPHDGAYTVVDALRALNGDAFRFADAYGAATSPQDTPRWVPLHASRGASPGPRRLVLAFAVAGLGFLLALAAPIIGPARAERAASRELAGLAPPARAAATVRAEQERFSGALDEVRRFRGRGRRATWLLAELTRSLPDSTAIAGLRMDSSVVHTVIIGRRAQAALAAVERIPAVESPEILGPVTREAADGIEVERVTVRFRIGGIP